MLKFNFLVAVIFDPPSAHALICLNSLGSTLCFFLQLGRSIDALETLSTLVSTLIWKSFTIEFIRKKPVLSTGYFEA